MTTGIAMLKKGGMSFVSRIHYFVVSRALSSLPTALRLGRLVEGPVDAMFEVGLCRNGYTASVECCARRLCVPERLRSPGDGQLDWLHTTNVSGTLTIFDLEQGPGNRGGKQVPEGPLFCSPPRGGGEISEHCTEYYTALGIGAAVQLDPDHGQTQPSITKMRLCSVHPWKCKSLGDTISGAAVSFAYHQRGPQNDSRMEATAWDDSTLHPESGEIFSSSCPEHD